MPLPDQQQGVHKVMQGLALSHVALPQARAATHCVALADGNAVSQMQWSRWVRAWCATFSRVQGEEIGLYFDDALQFSAALWGAWHAGKTPVLLSDLLPHTLHSLMPQLSGCAGELQAALQPDEAKADTVTLQPLSLQASRLLLFTSGSTGEPQRIVKQLAQLDAEVHSLQAAFGADCDAPGLQVLSTVSHQHIYGLLFRVLWPLSAARPLGLRYLHHPQELVQALSRPGSTLLVSSPAMLCRLPPQLEWARAQQGLRAIFSSGGPLSLEASQQCRSLLGSAPCEVFGSSETGGIAWRRQAGHDGSWQPLPGVQIRLADSGCLAVRSAHLPQPLQWWETADRVVTGPASAGFVLLGRVDRIVKIAQKRVSLTALEEALLGSDWVRLARAVVLEQAGAERVGMVLELTPAGWQALQEHGRRQMGALLRARLAPRVEAVALPRSWRYVLQMPVNAQGKTTQHSLVALFRPVTPQPQWTDRGPHQATASLQVNEDLRVMDGHFPGAALVPGVAQLHWVVTLGMQAFGIAAQFDRAQAIKFQQPIVPGDRVQVQLQWFPEEACLQFLLASDRGTHASGRLLQGA